MNSSVSIDSLEMTHKKSRSLLQDYAIHQQTAENKIYRSGLRIYACDTRERVTLNAPIGDAVRQRDEFL